MSTSLLTIGQRRAAASSRWADYAELTKPKIALLVLVTLFVASVVSSWGQPDPWLTVHALLGTALVAASGSAWNQWLERKSDAKMARTEQRPLPAGRLTGSQVVLFGTATILLGLLYLAWFTGIVTSLLAALTWVLYVAVYTPLKSRTSWNTAVGAVAGALPTLIGWTAVGGSIDQRAWALFVIVYLWQFPHFMAIAWIYRHQYAAAGQKMLPVVEPSGHWAGAQAVAAASVLVPVSLLPAVYGQVESLAYLLPAALLGVGQLACALFFCKQRSDRSARRLLQASLVYLPALLFLMILIPWM